MLDLNDLIEQNWRCSRSTSIFCDWRSFKDSMKIKVRTRSYFVPVPCILIIMNH